MVNFKKKVILFIFIFMCCYLYTRADEIRLPRIEGKESYILLVPPITNKDVEGPTEEQLTYFDDYMRDLQKTIKSNWHPPIDSTSNRVTLLFSIDKEGNIHSIQLKKSSGLPATDISAIRAVSELKKFRPLPKEYDVNEITIEFNFDFNVYGMPVDLCNYGKINKYLYAANKKNFIKDGNYIYFNAVEFIPHIPMTKLMECKIDCAQKLIGVKKSDLESTFSGVRKLDSAPDVKSADTARLVPVRKKKYYKQIYNYACKP